MSFFANLFDKHQKDQVSDNLERLISNELFKATPEAVLYLDKAGHIIQANRRVEEWLGYSPESIIGMHISHLPFVDSKNRILISKAFSERLKGKSIPPYEIQFETKDRKKMLGRIHGSVVKDQRDQIVGAIIMISNITEITRISEDDKSLYRDLRILSETASGLVELPKSEDIYQFIGEKLFQLLNENQVAIQKYLPEEKSVITTYYFGAKPYEVATLKALKLWPIGRKFILEDYAHKSLLTRDLVLVKGGIYEIFQGQISKQVASVLQATAKLEKIYTMGFAWEGELFGSAVVYIRKGSVIRPESISAFLHQASVALQKRKADEALQKAHDELEIKVEERTADLKKSNAELEKFMLAVKDASDTIVITDSSGKIVYANQAAEKNTGFAFPEMQGKTPALWIIPEDTRYNEKIWDEMEKQKVVALAEYKNKNKDGREYISEVHVSPIFDEKPSVIFFVWIERDITKAKEIDQAKTEFVSLASHQLRTPLSAINWYTEMLIDGDAGDVNEDQKNYLNEIYRGSKRMVDLVNSLLNVSRLELGTFIVEPTVTSLESIARDVVNEMKSQIIKKKLMICEDYSSDVPQIPIDLKLIRIVFQNLISNAIKYTPENGRIEITIQIEKHVEEAKNILVTVKDTGYGIPKYQHDKIFSKLFRADNVKKMEAEGTGLGMYIVKQIIDETGGKIWFESEEDKGSIFYITIPLSGMKKREGSKELS